MSLRSYLFSLIGSLIILLIVCQLVLINWIEQNLTKEVNSQARFISEQVIELALEKFDQSQTSVSDAPSLLNSKNPSHGTEDNLDEQVKVIKTEGKIEVIDNENNNIDIETVKRIEQEALRILNNKNHQSVLKVHSPTDTEDSAKIMISRHQLSDEFRTIVTKIHKENEISRSSQENVTVFVDTPHNTLAHNVERQSPANNATSELLKYVQWVLIACGLIALTLAYGLSIKFNKPLKELSAGFKQLARGNYKHQVNESGVKEIRETISHFNSTVNRLEKLTLAAKQHSEIAHLAELGEVSRGLAHALRNPIHTIGLSIEQLTNAQLSKQQQDSLVQTIQNKISHIDKNIKALLTLTTTGINRDEQVPILAVLQDIILEYKLCQNKPQQFDLNVEPTLKIIGSESEIRSIFHTLIYNACDANDNNEQIKITAKTVNEHSIVLTVVDQGPGIDKSIEQQLFQPHISTKPEGAGMGIYIANRIISLHYHGEITLVNNSDVGCTASAIFMTKEVS